MLTFPSHTHIRGVMGKVLNNKLYNSCQPSIFSKIQQANLEFQKTPSNFEYFVKSAVTNHSIDHDQCRCGKVRLVIIAPLFFGIHSYTLDHIHMYKYTFIAVIVWRGCEYNHPFTIRFDINVLKFSDFRFGRFFNLFLFLKIFIMSKFYDFYLKPCNNCVSDSRLQTKRMKIE